MNITPDHSPTMDEGSGVVSWTDPEGRQHHLHTDPEESASFLSFSNALVAGRDDLRMILDSTAFWMESVTDAGLPPADAVDFIKGRVNRELEQLTRLLVDGRLTTYVEQLLSQAPETDEDAEEEVEL